MSTRTAPLLATKAEAAEDHLDLTLSGGGSVRIPWRACSQKLAHATLIQRQTLSLSPSGYGIHWPLLDEDLAVGPLVEAAGTPAFEHD